MRLVKTCNWAPEQYDVYDGDRVVGYLRLRHGRFTAEAVDGAGWDKRDVEPVLVYSADWDDDLKGEFDGPTERDTHLPAAVAALETHYRTIGEATQ